MIVVCANGLAKGQSFEVDFSTCPFFTVPIFVDGNLKSYEQYGKPREGQNTSYLLSRDVPEPSQKDAANQPGNTAKK